MRSPVTTAAAPAVIGDFAVALFTAFTAASAVFVAVFTVSTAANSIFAALFTVPTAATAASGAHPSTKAQTNLHPVLKNHLRLYLRQV